MSERSSSNMAVMEVNFPSGFTADVDSLPSLEVSQNVQKVETTNGLTKAILYFNNIKNKIEYCPTVSAFRTHKVANQKPVSVVVYDYYDSCKDYFFFRVFIFDHPVVSARRARLFYRARQTTLCDICEEEDCGYICTSRIGHRTENDENSSQTGTSSNGHIITIHWVCIVAVAFQWFFL